MTHTLTLRESERGNDETLSCYGGAHWRGCARCHHRGCGDYGRERGRGKDTTNAVAPNDKFGQTHVPLFGAEHRRDIAHTLADVVAERGAGGSRDRGGPPRYQRVVPND